MNLSRLLWCGVIALAIAAISASAARAEEAHAPSTGQVTESPAAEAIDPLVVDPDLAVWTFGIFVLLLIVLGKFAWGPIIASLEKREHGIAEHIAQAERNHAEAKKVLADYEQKLTNAAGEVRELMEAARRDAEHNRQTILAEAKSAADAERNRALRDIEAAGDAALESLAERSAQLAVDLAGKILQSKLSKDEHAKLIQDALAKFPAGSSSNN